MRLLVALLALLGCGSTDGPLVPRDGGRGDVSAGSAIRGAIYVRCVEVEITSQAGSGAAAAYCDDATDTPIAGACSVGGEGRLTGSQPLDLENPEQVGGWYCRGAMPTTLTSVQRADLVACVYCLVPTA